MASEWFARELLAARGGLFGFILSLARDFELAEELFQEVSVRILEREEDFERGTNFGAWAREFARRTVLEEQRRKGRIRFSPEAIRAVADRFAGVDEDHQTRREALRLCMEEMDEGARRLVDLRYEESLSMDEIGSRLDRSPGAVQVALSRTRAWLLKCIERRIAAGAPA